MSDSPTLPSIESRRALLTGIGGLAAGALIAARPAKAGPLDPPAGPITPTPGPEPRIAINATNTPGDATTLHRITQPGSYYLTSNLTGIAGKDGIRVLADNVTIDLGGFVVQGVANSGSGIIGDGFSDNVLIRNGTVTGWGLHGLDLMADQGFAVGAVVESIRAVGNTKRGISVPDSAIVRNCLASQNGTEGIRVRSFTGALGKAVVESCEASDNAGIGILVAAGSTVAHCTAVGNAGGGISTLSDCLVTACTARANVGSGIALGVGSAARGCQVSSVSSGDGITASSNAAIVGNNCHANSGGAGIRVSGSRTRVEANQCTSNATGLLVTGSNNIIVGNTCGSNTTSNWNIAANNVFGVIVDRTNPGSFAVNGNSSPSSLGTTEPNANFTY